MNFQQAVVSCFKNYAKANGRASRSEFWYFNLFCLLAGIVAVILDMVLFPSHPTDQYHDGFHPIDTVLRIALFLPSIAVSIRRLHDFDRKGTWLLIGLTIIGLLFPLLYWNCTKGTDGPNRFGDDPLAS